MAGEDVTTMWGLAGGTLLGLRWTWQGKMPLLCDAQPLALSLWWLWQGKVQLLCDVSRGARSMMTLAREDAISMWCQPGALDLWCPWHGKTPFPCDASRGRSIYDDLGTGRCHFHVMPAGGARSVMPLAREDAISMWCQPGALDLWWPWHGKMPFPCDASRGRSIYDDLGTGRCYFHVMPAGGARSMMTLAREDAISIWCQPGSLDLWWPWHGKMPFPCDASRVRSVCDDLGTGRCHFHVMPAGGARSVMTLAREDAISMWWQPEALDLWWPWHGKTPFPCDASRGRSVCDDLGTRRCHYHVAQTHNIGIQMNPQELTKTFIMMIANWKKTPLWSPRFEYKKKSSLQGLTLGLSSPPTRVAGPVTWHDFTYLYPLSYLIYICWIWD